MLKSILSAAAASFLLLVPARSDALARPVKEPARPSLVVTLVIDQFSANLFKQYRGSFTGGLATLAEQGIVYANGYQTHGITVTCAGHSTVLTGMHPTHTGISANDWVDLTTGEEVYCLHAPGNHLAHGDDTTDNGPVGPEQLSATTLTDWLKDQSPQSRVFAVSGKDRGAINLNGHRGDGAYWFTEGFGLTTYVEPGQVAAERLAPVAAFNASIQSRLVSAPWGYTREDCRALARDWEVRGGTFHSALPIAAPSFDDTPVRDELTVDAALYLMQTQNLGRRGVTDMLGVSLSGTDAIGHTYGTQGPEMCEQLHRLDAALGRLLAALPEHSLVVLTADHGGSDMAERQASHGFPEAHRVSPTLRRDLNAMLRQRFGLDFDPMRSGAWGLIITGADKKGLSDPLRGQIADAAAEYLNSRSDDVFLAIRRERVMALPIPDTRNPEELTVPERLRLSAVEGRAPDVYVVWQPGVMSGGGLGENLSTHGLPWDYDRRVPILFWTQGGAQEERFYPIRTVDIAPTLANIMGVRPADSLDGRCLTLDLPGAPVCPAP